MNGKIKYNKWKDKMPGLLSNIGRGAGEFVAEHFGAGVLGALL